MQKGIVLKRGQRYLQAKDGYVYPFTKALASNRGMIEIFPFKEPEPEPEGLIADGISEEVVDHMAVLRERFNDDKMTKRKIAEEVGLDMTRAALRSTGKPKIVEKAINILLGGDK